MLNSLVCAILVGLTAWRITRFIIADTLIDGIRQRVVWVFLASRRGLTARKLVELLTCPYCLSVWVTAAVWAATWRAVPSMELPWLVLGASTTVAMMTWRHIEG